MAKSKSDDGLFDDVPSQEAPPAPDLKAKVEALIDAHFPALHGDGVEAHQPLRQFLLDFAALL